MADALRQRADFLDTVRAIAIVLVVAIHARARVELEPGVADLATFICFPIAVPIFFLCDGYLFALQGVGRLRGGHLEYLRKSARRLLVPWAVFSLIYTVARGAFEASGLLEEHVVLGRSVLPILRDVYASEIAPQMYFLVSLFLIRAISPAFVSLLELAPAVAWGVFLAWALLYGSLLSSPLEAAFDYGMDPVLHAAWGIQFFLAGMALARSRSFIESRAGRLAAGAWLGLAALLGRGLDAVWNPGAQYAYLFAAFLTCMAVGGRARPLSAMGRQTMGIYLLHAPVLLRIVDIPVSALFSSSILRYGAIVIGTTALSWGGARLLARFPIGAWAMGMGNASESTTTGSR